MPLSLHEPVGVLSGDVGVEDAEPVIAWLRGTSGARVDLGGCTHLHTSVLQVLLVAGVEVAVPPRDPVLREHVEAAFGGEEQEAAGGGQEEGQ